MSLIRFKDRRPRRRVLASLSLAAGAAAAVCAAPAYGQRVKGLDTSSAANGVAPSQTLWNSAFSQGFQFAILRSSRGGTVEGSVIDSQFYDNTQRATTAGMITGSYHYTRPDLTGHTGADEATHYM